DASRLALRIACTLFAALLHLPDERARAVACGRASPTAVVRVEEVREQPGDYRTEDGGLRPRTFRRCEPLRDGRLGCKLRCLLLHTWPPYCLGLCGSSGRRSRRRGRPAARRR